MWRDRKVLVTGHTGFKGSWLALWLSRLGAAVSGLALDPPTDPSNFTVSRVRGVLDHHFFTDVRDFEAVRGAFRTAQPEVVFHLAAQPIVRAAVEEPRATFETNVMGTVNVLEAIRLQEQPCTVIVVTSDKCYERRSAEHRHLESDALGGTEPYGTSKAAAELACAAYRSTYFSPDRFAKHGVGIATVRAGNVIGGGDWAADRIVPDVVRALTAGQPVMVRNPYAIRPWQHVLEPLSGYLLLAERLLAIRPGVAGGGDEATTLCSAWNFGPQATDEVAVRTIVESAIEEWGAGTWVPEGGAGSGSHEAPYLRLDSGRANEVLGWHPAWDYRQAVRHATRWYLRHAQDPGAGMVSACMDDIVAYETAVPPQCPTQNEPVF